MSARPVGPGGPGCPPAPATAPQASSSPGAPGVASWLGHRNPTALLGVLVLLGIATLVVWDPGTALVLYAAVTAGVLATARIGVTHLLRAQVPFVLFGVGIVLVNAMTRPGEVLWSGVGVRITAEGLSIGAALALRTLVIGVSAVAFAHVTEPRRLMVSLIRHAHLSPRYAYALLAGQRMLADLPAQWRTLTRARMIRRPHAAPMGEREPRLGVRELASCAFALLVGAVRGSERMAFALESRGLGTGPRMLWRPVALGPADVVMVIVAVAVLVGILAGRAVLG